MTIIKYPEKQMFVLSGKIGHNFWSYSVALIVLLSIIVSVPSVLHGQSNEFGHNSVKLIWTASGDDNNLGQAWCYDIRYSTEPVLADTASWWEAAKRVENPPTPSPSGSKDSCLIDNLSPNQHYYFTIKVADEVYNWSYIINVIEMPKVFCADVNGDGSFDTLDLIYLLSFLYHDGPAPAGPAIGDVDRSGGVDILDVIYILNFFYKFGPPPDCGN